MTARTERGLALKWISVLTLFTILPFIITDLTIVQVYREELKGSLIAVEGIVLIVGVLFSFFLTRKLALPFEERRRINYLQKPFTVDMLARKGREVLDKN